MFDPNQGQQGQPPQQIMFQGQSQGQGQVQLNVTPQNAQGQQGPQQRRYTEEERQKVVASLRQIVEKYGQESPQAKQAHAQFKQWMLQYYTHAHNRQQGQSSEPQTAQGRQAIGHSVANPAQFKPPANGDPQAVHRFRLGLTSRYAQGQQRMKQIREQLHIQSNKVQALQAAGGQGTENQQLQQIKANMTELARQFKTIDAWCQGALQSGQLLTQPNRMQTASETATVSATVGGGSQQPSIAGIDQQQQEQQPQPTTAPALAPASAPESTPTPAPESAPALAPESALPPASASAPASAPVSAPAPAPAPPPSGSQPGPPPAQQNLGPPQQVQQQGQMASLQQGQQQPQQQTQIPPQVPSAHQHSPPPNRQISSQQANQTQNQNQHPSPDVLNRQQPLVRSSMSPTIQVPIPQQSPQMPPLQPQVTQQGSQPGPQQMSRQTPAPMQQATGGAQAVRQSPVPGTPATPTTQHHQQPMRDASVPPRPGSAQASGPAVPPGVPQQSQQAQSQQMQQPHRTASAAVQSPPPQQHIPQVADRNTAQQMPIPKSLHIEPKAPVAIQTRPTLSGGANTAGNHVMGTPALVKNPAFEFDEGGMGLLSKRKLEELVKQIDPDEKLDPEVEESVLELVDEFIDTVVTYACKMAKLRGSDTLDIKDMQIILERNWNIRVPGYAADEIRTVRKFIPAQGYVQKMSALAAGKALNQTNLKGSD